MLFTSTIFIFLFLPMVIFLYIAFFPQLIAGSIVRYTEIDRQIKARREKFQYISLGLCRFIIVSISER